MFGINGSEFLIILVVAVIVVGPERLPQYAEQLAKFVRGAKKFMSEAKSKVDAELGPEMQDIDWQKLDPRQYDPRRIVRETLIEDTFLDPQFDAKQAAKRSAGAVAGGGTAAGFAAGAVGTAGDSSLGGAGSRNLGFGTYTPLGESQAAPFDSEAT